MIVNQQRASQQRLTQNQLATPADVVGWMGAVQSQEYLSAKWSLGLRMQQPDDNAIEQAFAEGSILRTHILRPTWHFVLPADIRWMLALTAPRINALSAYYFRQVELDDVLLARTNDLIANALQGGKFLTRAEIGVLLADAGIVTDTLRLAHILMRAELDAVVCSGPRQGKQFTYALLAERAPKAKRLSREEALAELTRRYFTSHAPATVHDFAWWSGLTVTDARTGVEMIASELGCEVINGQPYWFEASMLPASETAPTAFLLPTFDEFVVGYDGFDVIRKGGRDASEFVFESSIVLNGDVIGSWKRTLKKNAVVVEVAPFTRLTGAEDEAVAAAIQRYSAFIGLPAVMQ